MDDHNTYHTYGRRESTQREMHLLQKVNLLEEELRMIKTKFKVWAICLAVRSSNLVTEQSESVRLTWRAQIQVEPDQNSKLSEMFHEAIENLSQDTLKRYLHIIAFVSISI